MPVWPRLATGQAPDRLRTSFFLFSLFFFLSTCTQPTDNDTVTFSGTVTLEGQEDHSGVTVSLYELEREKDKL
jgi:hypothetical protein